MSTPQIISPSQMVFLVDYDNVQEIYRRNGLVDLADRLLTGTSSKCALAGRANIRFYGGWYQEKVPTRKAEDLLNQIESFFPRTLCIGHNNVLISAELAQSLIVLPQQPFFYTYRNNPIRKGIKCTPVANWGCVNDQCPLKIIEEFFENEKCPNSNCSVTPRDILTRYEQKLVDTMILSDMWYLATKTQDKVVLVSSDDDFLPGIICLVSMDIPIVHIHPVPRRFTRTVYRKLTNSCYTELGL